MSNQTIGLLWDAYTPAVEGQITRDLIALKANGASNLIAVCPIKSTEVDRLLKALDVSKSPVEALATLWITYRTQSDPVEAPEHATQVIERNLFVDTSDPNIDPNGRPGYYLEPQGRGIAPSRNLNAPAPGNYGVTDPAIILLWG